MTLNYRISIVKLCYVGLCSVKRPDLRIIRKFIGKDDITAIEKTAKKSFGGVIGVGRIALYRSVVIKYDPLCVGLNDSILSVKIALLCLLKQLQYRVCEEHIYKGVCFFVNVGPSAVIEIESRWGYLNTLVICEAVCRISSSAPHIRVIKRKLSERRHSQYYRNVIVLPDSLALCVADDISAHIKDHNVSVRICSVYLLDHRFKIICAALRAVSLLSYVPRFDDDKVGGVNENRLVYVRHHNF